MKSCRLLFVFIGIVAVGLGGCGRIIDWGKASFAQGVDVPEFTSPEQYIRSIIIHDQFSTVASFDALWLVPEVRTAYAELRNYRSGKTEENKKAFLRRQLEENVHFLSFYVLSGQDVVLGGDLAKWSVMLKVCDRFYTPVEVVTVDLPIEYQYFFGKKFNRFKTAYLVRFDAKTIEGKCLIDTAGQDLSLIFRSAHKQGILSWYIIGADLVLQNREGA